MIFLGHGPPAIPSSERSALQAYDSGLGGLDITSSSDDSREPNVQSNYIAGIEMAGGESGPFRYCPERQCGEEPPRPFPKR